MNPRVKSVKPENNYTLLLEFSNGEVKRFDVSPYIGKGVLRLFPMNRFSAGKGVFRKHTMA